MNYNERKISVIIPSYNQGDYLEETILSIINQHYNNVEIIIMDGGSTDNSVDIIKKYSSHITYWQSKKDNGQSAAINEGIKKASGEFVTWLNSDDVLLANTLHTVNQYINKNPYTNWFLGNVLWLNKDGRIIKTGKVEPENTFWNSRNLFSNGGPTAFMRKKTLLEIGLLREDFDYMMDTELWHRFISRGHYFVRINKYCWGLRLHENAKMSGHNFSNSPLADKNHPSWIKKKKENAFMYDEYPINKWNSKIWRLYKLFTLPVLLRFLDRKYLNKMYFDI